jgi:hypothetical protein
VAASPTPVDVDATLSEDHPIGFHLMSTEITDLPRFAIQRFELMTQGTTSSLDDIGTFFLAVCSRGVIWVPFDDPFLLVWT